MRKLRGVLVAAFMLVVVATVAGAIYQVAASARDAARSRALLRRSAICRLSY